MESTHEIDAFTPDAEDAFPAVEVREELTRILESPAFKATPQRRRMLKFIVGETLAGRSSHIKGYTIGTAVMGRDENFDPNADPIVRLEARRLRHDLDSYYVSEGRSNALRISVPTGRYVPEFTFQELTKELKTTPQKPETRPADFPLSSSISANLFRVAGLVAVVVALALTIWSTLGSSDKASANLQVPSIAVLPFNVLSSHQEDDFLAASIASRVVSDLSRFPDIEIFSPIAGFSQKPKADPVELAAYMGVDFVVAGELRSDVGSVTVSTRLIDAKSGRVVWTETYDRNLNQSTLAVIESEISAGISSAIGQPYGALRSDIIRDQTDSSGPSISSYECVLNAYQFRRTYSPALHAPLVSCLNDVVRTEPDYAEAWAMLGFTRAVTAALSILPDYPDSTFEKGADAALRAIELEPDNATGLKVLSMIKHYQEDFEESERYVRGALEVNPNDPDALYQLGWRLGIRGRLDEGIPLLEQAIERTLNPPAPYFHVIAIDRLMKNEGEAMLDYAQRSATDGSAISQSLIAMAHGILGDIDAQVAALTRMNEIAPGYDPIAQFRNHKATSEIIAAMELALQPGYQSK